jgi:hypothetical protein
MCTLGHAALAKALQERLGERFLKRCDTTTPFFHLCVTVTRLIIARTWLGVYYPLSPKDNGTSLPLCIRDRLFAKVIEVFELTLVLLTAQTCRNGVGTPRATSNGTLWPLFYQKFLLALQPQNVIALGSTTKRSTICGRCIIWV